MAKALPKVLIVDDETSLLNSLMAFFEDEDFDVTGASSGEEALETLSKEHFDAVIIDMRLPGIDGNEVILQAKKSDPLLNSLSILVQPIINFHHHSSILDTDKNIYS